MHPQWKRLTASIALGSLLLLSSGATSEAGEPKEKIRQTINAVLAVLADPALSAPEKAQEKRAKIRQVITQRFGFKEMAQRAMGRHWRKLKAAQRQEFVALFSDLLERSYISKIEAYGGDPDDIKYLRERIDPDGRARVRTEILGSRDLVVEVEYRFLKRGSEWEVYDVAIEGVSLVNNYRTQFNKIIRQESYAALVKKMRLKLEQEVAVSKHAG